MNEPTIRTHGRTKQAEWLLETEPNGDAYVAVLSVYHSDRKRFFATVNQEKVVQCENGWTSRESWPMSATRLETRPVARYSEKARDAYFADMLSLVEQLRETEEVGRHFATKTEVSA